MQRYAYTPLKADDRRYTSLDVAQTEAQIGNAVAKNAARTDRQQERTPKIARLTKSVDGYQGLTSGASSAVSTVLDRIPLPASNLAANLDKNAFSHGLSGRSGWKVKEKGVEIEFEGAEHRSFWQGTAHLGHKHIMPGAQALLVLAGSHDKSHLFTDLLFDKAATSDDALKEVCHELQRGAFISLRCFRLAVHEAATRALQVKSKDTQSSGAGNEIYRAHRVVASFLVGMREKKVPAAAEDAFRLVMEALRPVDYMQPHDQSAYAAIVIGICLGGVMRFFKDELERGTKKQDRLKFALTALGTGVGCAPLAGPAVGGVINLLAEPVAKAAFKTRDMSEAVVRLGAGIEDEIRSNPPMEGYDWVEFTTQLANTMRHCGFAY